MTRTTLTKTYYLEMLARPAVPPPEPPAGVQVQRLNPCDTDEYLHLYRSVGGDHHWVDRLRMPRKELEAILQDPSTEVYVLWVDGKSAGFVELNRSVPDQVKVAYFGLFPEVIGRGLGKFFLDWTVHQAWSYQPRRVWLHTCLLDHPAALPNYQRAGFQIYDEKLVRQTLHE